MPPPETSGRVNELTELADFIKAHAAGEFDLHLGILLREAGELHDVWSGNCLVQHWHDETPCDEFERGISLGIAWLKARLFVGVTSNGS